MSFDIYDGQQQVDETELYLFRYVDVEGAVVHEALTTSATQVTATAPVFDRVSHDYLPDAISRSNANADILGLTATTKIMFHPNSQFAREVALGVIATEVKVAVMKISPAGDIAVRWVGYVTRGMYSARGVTIDCIGSLNKLKRKVNPRVLYTDCPWVVYGGRANGRGCPALVSSESQIADVEVATEADRGVISIHTVDVMPAESVMLGGALVFSGRSTSIQHVEQFGLYRADVTVTDASALTGIQVGDDVQIARGCDKTLNTCRTVFGQELYFGGFPDIPKGEN